MAEVLLLRFSTQQVMMQCMAELDLDAIVYPTSNLPPTKLGSPAGPSVNGRAARGAWSFIGGQGLPAITVPAGFTTEVYDLTRDPSAPLTPESAWDSRGRYRRLPGDDRTRLIGPIPARLPVGIDFAGLPYSEPTLLKIAAAYEAASKRREPPPAFGPLDGEP